MSKLTNCLTCGAASLVLVACFPFDAHNEQLDGPYRLRATDISEDMKVSYTLPSGEGIGRIPPTVFAVGWNSTHLIAKRHPDGDRARTEYYILERLKDSAAADPRASVRGPFDSLGFVSQRVMLGVDSQLRFTRVIRSLQ